jgi:septal ring factor EnvC (AmiA/AmiB activator)
MAVVPFDTLKLARRLEGAGFPPKQAGDTAEAIAEAMSGARLATADDIASVRGEITTLGSELRAEIAALRAELKAEISSVRTEIATLRAEFRAEISALRAELKADIAAVRAEMELLRRDLTIRLGGMMIVAVGIILAAIRYLPPAH